MTSIESFLLSLCLVTVLIILSAVIIASIENDRNEK